MCKGLGRERNKKALRMSDRVEEGKSEDRPGPDHCGQCSWKPQEGLE